MSYTYLYNQFEIVILFSLSFCAINKHYSKFYFLFEFNKRLNKICINVHLFFLNPIIFLKHKKEFYLRLELISTTMLIISKNIIKYMIVAYSNTFICTN